MIRLDEWLFENTEIQSLKKARAFILSGEVLVNNYPETSIAFQVKKPDQIRIRDQYKYYSRSALKLKKVLKQWKFPIKDHNFIDIGAAHGGFTQILLENKAKQVITVDVSYGQLHPNLRKDERVYCIERQNIFKLKKNTLPFQPDFFVSDLSFVSIRKLLVYLKNTWPDIQGICLFKPQFEAKPYQLEKGIVKKKEYQKSLIKDFQEFLRQQDIQFSASAPSSIKGSKGNQEYLFWIAL